ncbi:PREDICTED: acyl-CoA-binding domain-containing protein 3-like isoform X3 [Ipomoea nil]|uniref:acyl-CoA-binding domain-containing protein 3-like isoform X3 n=1 Tax=Ipomoea nil TaxID=35883 RepID=UPI000901F58E|nr:PREDICTED: acyl-CoA-binding domain-containing protein 3-like isoform X3 [Ipomoea nil]
MIEFLQGYVETALWALVFSCIIVKLVSSAVDSDGNGSAERRVVAVGDGDQVGTKGVREIDAESFDIVKVVDEDEGEVIVEKVQMVEQCGDARDGSWTGGESRNLGLSEVGASKIDALCGVEGKDVFGDVKVVGEEFKSEEVRKKNVVGTNLPTASGHIEGGFRQEDEGLSDDDWEGIERSDLEILFAKAINFVQCGNNDALSNLGSELKMQLYALQKTAMEGPCYEPQPMAFKVSARAKWNAWRRTGSMSSEAAMEQYVKLLSDTVPAWIRCSSTESCVDSSSAIGKTKLSRHSI